VRQHPDKEAIYLYMKTIERAHMPSKLWQRIKLSRNYSQALEQIDRLLIYWPQFLVHKCKQRLTRLTQVQIRSRRIAAEQERLGERLVPKLSSKVRTREAARERKAESAARVERGIERELLRRLREGNYGEQPLNVSEAIWKKVLGSMEKEGEVEGDVDNDEGIESEDEEEDDVAMEVEYVSDLEESEAELEDIDDWLQDSDEDEGDDDEDEDSTEEDATTKKRKASTVAKKDVKRAKVAEKFKKPVRKQDTIKSTLEW